MCFRRITLKLRNGEKGYRWHFFKNLRDPIHALMDFEALLASFGNGALEKLWWGNILKGGEKHHSLYTPQETPEDKTQKKA